MLALSTLQPNAYRAAAALYETKLHAAAHAHSALCKSAAEPELSYSLAGRLYLSKSGWLLLSVPNALVRGLFDALHEPGAELPANSDDRLQAHITVMDESEVKKIGEDKITERGHMCHFSLGPIKTVRPLGGSGISRVWYVTVSSPELGAIRRSYGLESRPHNGEYDFHITFAVRKNNALWTNDVSKAAAALAVDEFCRQRNVDHLSELSADDVDRALAVYEEKQADQAVGGMCSNSSPGLPVVQQEAATSEPYEEPRADDKLLQLCEQPVDESQYILPSQPGRGASITLN